MRERDEQDLYMDHPALRSYSALHDCMSSQREPPTHLVPPLQCLCPLMAMALVDGGIRHCLEDTAHKDQPYLDGSSSHPSYILCKQKGERSSGLSHI